MSRVKRFGSFFLLVASFAAFLSNWGSGESFSQVIEEVKRPETLQDAIQQLDVLLDLARKEELRSTEKWELAGENARGLGWFVRAEWLSGKDSALRQHFRELNIVSPESMSEIVVRAYWTSLQVRSVDEREIIDEMNSFYRRLGILEDMTCPDDSTQALEEAFTETKFKKIGEPVYSALWAQCPSTGKGWIFEAPPEKWRPANAAESQHIDVHISKKHDKAKENAKYE